MSVNFKLFKKLVGNKIFTVTFEKKTTGEIVERTYKVDDESEQVYENKNYLTVYDINKKDYRTLVLDNIIEVHINNKVLKYDELIKIDETCVNSLIKKSEKLPIVKIDESISKKISNALLSFNSECIYGNSI